MLRSLYAGVSGLRNHQVKLDILGNNIANVNTIGFKSSRIVFSQALTQAFVESTNSSGTGFVNSPQIGLGVQVNSIDRQYNQGAFEGTGNVTDLAIEGDGFFIVNNGENQLYTRTGNFLLDETGHFVNSKGYNVQGWILGPDGTTPGSPGLEDIRIDGNILSDAKATENIRLSGNLDAGLLPRSQVWTSTNAMQERALLTGTAVTAPLTVTAGTNDEFFIELSGNSSTITEQITLTAGTYATVDDLVAEINAQIAANANLTGTIEAENDGGMLKFGAVNGIASTRITLNSGVNDALGDLGFMNGDTAIGGTLATGTTEINDLLTTTTDLVSGDILSIIGTTQDGSTVDAVFTYGVDGTTIQDFVDAISAAYPTATATLVDGQIVLTDDTPGESESTVSFSAASTNTGAITLPGFRSTEDGFTGRTSASILVYDSLGGGHNLLIEFTKTESPGEWTWEITPGGDESILSGGSGKALFDEFGDILAFSYDNNDTALLIDSGNDAATMELSIETNAAEGISGLSQFDAASTFYVSEQDGRATGLLQGLSIDRNGVITGSFSNGDILGLAQIAMARFANNRGLTDMGDGLTEVSISSGTPDIFALNDSEGGSIAAGALEMSNVDLAREFTDLIVAQRGFQANAKVITTADSILDELIRIKR